MRQQYTQSVGYTARFQAVAAPPTMPAPRQSGVLMARLGDRGQYGQRKQDNGGSHYRQDHARWHGRLVDAQRHHEEPAWVHRLQRVWGRDGGSGSPFGFGGANGCQTDPDAILVLMGHRYYDPRVGRFLTQDPAQDGGNWYAHVGNNPTNRSDPLGLYWAGGTLPGDYTPAEVEATAEAHDADPGQTFNVTTGDGHKYSFTVPGGGAVSNWYWRYGMVAWNWDRQ